MSILADKPSIALRKFIREGGGSNFARISKYSLDTFPACSRWVPLLKNFA
jgi:hypothetical protein